MKNLKKFRKNYDRIIDSLKLRKSNNILLLCESIKLFDEYFKKILLFSNNFNFSNSNKLLKYFSDINSIFIKLLNEYKNKEFLYKKIKNFHDIFTNKNNKIIYILNNINNNNSFDFKDKDFFKKINKIILQLRKHLKFLVSFLPNILESSVVSEDKIIYESKNSVILNNLLPIKRDLINNFFFSNESVGRGFVFYNEVITEFFDYLVLYLKNYLRVNGFKVVSTPNCLNEFGVNQTGHFSFFNNELINFEIGSKKKFFLLPTAELSLFNYNKITSFPFRLSTFTNCYRREGGASGLRDSNFHRLYEFRKLEMFIFCKKQNWKREFQLMISLCKDVLEKFGICFEIIKNSAYNTSFQSSITYDINSIIFGKKIELSSISYCSEYQVLNSEYSKLKNKTSDENNDIVTLNGSFFGMERFIKAILHNCIFYNKTNKQFELSFIIKKNLFNDKKLLLCFERIVDFLNEKNR